MNCDQVFDILTRGPFPTGTPCDAGVEAHLDACGECRRLAEALRPALELFQEAIGPEESRDLPGYWCAVADRPQAAGRLVRRGPRRESRAAAAGLEPPHVFQALVGIDGVAAGRVLIARRHAGIAGAFCAVLVEGFSAAPSEGPIVAAAAPHRDDAPPPSTRRLSTSEQCWPPCPWPVTSIRRPRPRATRKTSTRCWPRPICRTWTAAPSAINSNDRPAQMRDWPW